MMMIRVTVTTAMTKGYPSMHAMQLLLFLRYFTVKLFVIAEDEQ